MLMMMAAMMNVMIKFMGSVDDGSNCSHNDGYGNKSHDSNGVNDDTNRVKIASDNHRDQ